jgi:hypothetical protein
MGANETLPAIGCTRPIRGTEPAEIDMQDRDIHTGLANRMKCGAGNYSPGRLRDSA